MGPTCHCPFPPFSLPRFGSGASAMTFSFLSTGSFVAQLWKAMAGETTLLWNLRFVEVTDEAPYVDRIHPCYSRLSSSSSSPVSNLANDASTSLLRAIAFMVFASSTHHPPCRCGALLLLPMKREEEKKDGEVGKKKKKDLTCGPTVFFFHISPTCGPHLHKPLPKPPKESICTGFQKWRRCYTRFWG